MTVREAILRAVPVFVEHPGSGPDTLRTELAKSGIPVGLAAEVVEFLPLAVARAMLNGMGIRFQDHYVRQTAQGHVIGQKKLTDEPVFSEGSALADEISRMGERALLAVVNWSVEYQAVSKAMSGGGLPAEMECPAPVMLANNDDRRVFDGASSESQQKPWWKFWG